MAIEIEEHKKWIEKANILIEALPYIQKFYKKTIVIKYGGSAMIEPELKRCITKDIVLMKYVGIEPVIVHGGGMQVTELMKKLGKDSIFINGLRITDMETMKITEMVLTGQINKEIVMLINIAGGKAVGISGKDGGLIIAEKYKKADIDYGYTGKIKEINTEILFSLKSNGFIPVISPIGMNKKGESYNINADTVAAEISIALQAEKLIYLTDIRGICYDQNDEKTFIPAIKISELIELQKKKKITEGMLPKIESCIKAIKNNVKKIHIIDGRIPHSLLLEIFTEAGVGTEILP